MSLLLESILYERGKMPLLDRHIQRMNRSREIMLKCSNPLIFPHRLSPPENLQSEKLKLRILYDCQITSLSWIPYQKAKPKKILVVESPKINYSLKYADRTPIDQLKSLYADYDDLILLHNEVITDATYSNILLKIGGSWYTPSNPLLNGIRRQFLIQRGLIQPAYLRKEDLALATAIKLINAMMPMNDCIDLAPDQLVFNKKL